VDPLMCDLIGFTLLYCGQFFNVLLNFISIVRQYNSEVSLVVLFWVFHSRLKTHLFSRSFPP